MRNKLVSMLVVVGGCCCATMAQQRLRVGASAGMALHLSQQECREMALRHNEDLKKADAAVQKAELDRQIAFAAYLPKLDGSLSALYMNDQDLSGQTLQLHGMYMAGIQIVEPLYAGGQITAANKLAKLGMECQEEQRRKTRSEVIAEVDKAYFNLISVHGKVQMLEAISRQIEELGRKVGISVDAELATSNDLLRVQTKLSELKYQLQKARNGEELCRLALESTLGLNLDEQVYPIDTVLAIAMPSSLDESIVNRPELALLQKNVSIKEAQLKKERSNYLPTVALSAGYTYYGNLKMKGTTQLADGSLYNFSKEYKDGVTIGMLSVSVPLFHWGAEFKKVKKAKIDLEDARLDLQKNTRLLSIEVRQAVQNLTSGYQMIETAELGQRQADENLRVMQNKYDASMATLTDLLEAESQWQQAHSNLIEAQTQYKIYETEYLRVTGVLE